MTTIENAAYLFGRLEQVFECALEAGDFSVCFAAVEQQRALLEAHPGLLDTAYDDTCEDCGAVIAVPVPKTGSN